MTKYNDATMKVVSCYCLLAILLLLPASSYSIPAEKERIEEGHYALLKNGGLIAESEHSWTLWRLPDGRFELEDHFQADKTALAWYAGILSSGVRMSPEFKNSLQGSVEPTDLSAVFNPDRQLQSLTVSGVKLNRGKGVGLTCKAGSTSIECTGTNGRAKLRVDEPRALFWWYQVPLLLRSWLGSPQEGLSDNKPQRIALLSFGVAAKEGAHIGMKAQPGKKVSWGDKPELETADLVISNFGPDALVVGDKTFHAQKYGLIVKVAKGDPLSLTAWTDAKGVILAVQDASAPGYLTALVEYKFYSKSPPATATQPQL